MAAQPFEVLIADRGLPAGSLLRTMEELVVESHRRLHQDKLGEAWSPQRAYHWIRYENPDPAARLLAASEELERDWRAAGGGIAEGADPERVLDAVEDAAVELGFRPQPLT